MTMDFLTGWDWESEQEDFRELLNYQEYCGEQFLFVWKDVRDRIYEEARLFADRRLQTADGSRQHVEDSRASAAVCGLPSAVSSGVFWEVKDPHTDYTVAQTKTNGCVSYGVSAGVEDTLCLGKQKGREVEVFRSCAPWLYGGYHNIIKGRPGTGGCSMSGMMRFIAQHGILPYDTQPKIYADGEVDWHVSAKSWKRIYEKYGAEAARFQIKVAKLPRNYEDIVACLRAGYAVPYGTDKKLVLDKKTGYYYLSGRMMHCMSWSGFGAVQTADSRRQTTAERADTPPLASAANCGLPSADYFTYNKNSWLDGRGKQRLSDVKTQVNSNYFDCFVVLDIERTRKSKPNFGL
jgi:hypothetical protein